MYKTTDGKILECLRDTLRADPFASQRDLARGSGLSLGMLNAAVKRFAARGWIALTNLNARKIQYALTDEGFAELARRSNSFVRRTFSLVGRYGNAVVDALEREKRRGVAAVVLAGKSNIVFLIEYACQKCGLEFRVEDGFAPAAARDVLLLAGELTDGDELSRLLAAGCVNVMTLVEQGE